MDKEFGERHGNKLMILAVTLMITGGALAEVIADTILL